ncbi:MAG: type II secretion system protein [Clostridia bacterium]
MREKRKQRGITLIALVITIIVLVILAGVAINTLVGENGIITQAQRAKNETAQGQKEEAGGLASLEQQIDEATGKTYIIEKGVNKPRLAEGMKAIKFTNPSESAKGEVKESSENDTEWYDYNSKRWANSQTEDGSMWVWIPRYAYKVNASSKTFDVKFLIGITDNYYDENGNIQTAKRCNSENENVDTTTGYTVHPAFTDETAISYRNGGWDKELTGIWVAKFEAGYASGNNSATVKASSVSYTQSTAWVKALERNQSTDGSEDARNWLDGIYGSTTTAIKYPTFQGTTYSMNYINHNDAYNIAKAMTESGNIYGLTEGTDSHLMKNSEWGAVAYLSQSKYGLETTEIMINNINLNSGGKARTNTAGKSGVDSVYAVTGCTTGSTSASEKVTTIDNINGTTANTAVDGVYTWNQLNGTKASSSGTIYGIYDLSGGTWERTTAYVANGREELKIYGSSIAYDGSNLKTVSTKYTTAYPFDSTTDNTSIVKNNTNLNVASTNNYKKNTLIYGDGIYETSMEGTGSTSWYDGSSYYTGLISPFLFRGGSLWNGSDVGLFSFSRGDGINNSSHGFRTVLAVS